MTQYFDIWKSIRVRYLVVACILPFFYVPGFWYLVSFLEPGAPEFKFDIAYALYWQTILFLATLLTATLPVVVPARKMLGCIPSAGELFGGLKLAAYLYVFAFGAAYLLFIPLSYWIPTFVTYWFIEYPYLVIYHNESYPVLPNLLNLMSLCVLAPVLEEFAFRGVILTRWTHKYGVKTAVIGSSALFGILHSDPLGAFAFGVGMCALYLRSQSLILPIICHSIYNLVVWLVELGYFVFDEPNYEYTLEMFQESWVYGAIAILITVIWTVWYFQRPARYANWTLPAI